MSVQENRLREALTRLEASSEKLVKTRGYTKQSKAMKALEELIREQIRNANSRSSTGQIR